MVESDVVEERIRAKVEGVEHLVIKDLTGTKDHYEATVVASAFEGLNKVKQHQMVYAALDELIKGASAPVHALALHTFTPAKWAEKEGA